MSASGTHHRLLVAATDAQYGRWLVHRIETLREDCAGECVDFDEFRRRRSSLTLRDADLLVLVLDFAADGASSMGLDWLRKLKEQPGLPPVLAIAENGDELAAVRALRLGATDYLPRAAVSPATLAVSIDYCLRQATRQRATVATAPPAATPPPSDDEAADEGDEEAALAARPDPALRAAAATGRIHARHGLPRATAPRSTATVALKVTRSPDAEAQQLRARILRGRRAAPSGRSSTSTTTACSTAANSSRWNTSLRRPEGPAAAPISVAQKPRIPAAHRGGAVGGARRRASCTATSSRRTSCCARMARSC